MPGDDDKVLGQHACLARAHLDGLQDAEISATGAPVRIDQRPQNSESEVLQLVAIISSLSWLAARNRSNPSRPQRAARPVFTVFAIHDLDLPHGLAVAICRGLGDLSRTRLLRSCTRARSDKQSPGLPLRSRRARAFTLQNAPHLRGYCGRFERLAVVLQNVVVDAVARFRAQMTRKLAGGIHLDADGALAILENLGGLARVERQQIFEMERLAVTPEALNCSAASRLARPRWRPSQSG